ncbi:MAG: DUF192 domain-containing protein [Pseudobdellovibrionaceae bacterium]
MQPLKISSKNKLTGVKIKLADSLWARSIGLLSTNHLPDNEALWIPGCNWIHTCFMSFSIDCIFLDAKMKVQGIAENVKPWRFSRMYWKASSVIEMAAGQARANGIELGDILHVGN